MIDLKKPKDMYGRYYEVGDRLLRPEYKNGNARLTECTVLEVQEKAIRVTCGELWVILLEPKRAFILPDEIRVADAN